MAEEKLDQTRQNESTALSQDESLPEALSPVIEEEQVLRRLTLSAETFCAPMSSRQTGVASRPMCCATRDNSLCGSAFSCSRLVSITESAP